MFYKKKGKPAVGDVVICTVDKILYHSVFVRIDEYENVDGMIHISEIAPGRIRNLRDYVIEGKKIVVKVLDINKQGQIDLSLRRVPLNVRIAKLNEYKQEEKAEKLVELIGKDFKIDLKKFYETIGKDIVERYGGIYPFFQAVAAGGRKVIDEFKPEAKFSGALYNVVKEKIKAPEVTVDGTLVLRSYSISGLDDLKNILGKLIESNIDVHYLGAPNYKLTVVSSNYKKAESVLKGGVESATVLADKLKCEFKFIKNE